MEQSVAHPAQRRAEAAHATPPRHATAPYRATPPYRAPSPHQAQKLLDFSGDLDTLDRPERVLRSVADIPRLQGRIQAMIFKAQLESEIEPEPEP